MVNPPDSSTIVGLLSRYFNNEIGVSNYTFLVPHSQLNPIVTIKVGYDPYGFKDGTPMRTLEATIEGRISFKDAEKISLEVLSKTFDDRLPGVSASTYDGRNHLNYTPAKDRDHYGTLTLMVNGDVDGILSVAGKLDQHFLL